MLANWLEDCGFPQARERLADIEPVVIYGATVSTG
jgi:hypothetical protein